MLTPMSWTSFSTTAGVGMFRIFARQWIEALTGGQQPTEAERNLREQVWDSDYPS